jgi:hypothetical protein
LEQIIGQLESVRGRARRMLITMRIAQWAAAVCAALIGAGVADFALRLPGWLRLILVLAGAGYALYKAVEMIGRSIRVKPALTTIALRLERLHPQAAGHLASAVAFSQFGSGADESPIANQLAELTTSEAHGLVNEQEVKSLLDPKNLIIALVALLLSAGTLGSVAVATPELASIAAQRWFAPLGDARWPNRNGVKSMTDLAVAANNAPVRFDAQVFRGDKAKLRTWVHYRFIDGEQPGVWQQALMTRQESSETVGHFRRLVEPQSDADAVEFYFEAGDDVSDTASIQLIQPPSLIGLTAQVEAPQYAQMFIAGERHYLLEVGRESTRIESLVGSRIDLHLRVEGSFDAPPTAPGDGKDALHAWVISNMPGLIGDTDAETLTRMDIEVAISEDVEGSTDDVFDFHLSWTLTQSAELGFNFRDAYDNTYEDERRFLFDARVDREPRVTILQPAADESVLPTAAIQLLAEAQDDVAIEHVALRMLDVNGDPTTLNEIDELQPRQQLPGELDLEPLALSPGDSVAVIAVTRDNFDLFGEQHEPVESSPRILKIIGDEELSRQLRTGLADLRQRAIRAGNVQRRLNEAPADRETAMSQKDITERVESMQETLREIVDRATRNRLNEEALNQTLAESKKLLSAAHKASESAAGRMEQLATQPEPADADLNAGRIAQKGVTQNLDELVQLLDQGRDAYELRQKLVKLAKDQRELIAKTQEVMPRTLGKTQDQLSAAEKQELADIAAKQQELSEEAKRLSERMRSTAAAMSRQSQKPEDQAAAEAMRQAAETATEKELEQKMQSAAEKAEQNQLAQAQQDQQEAQQVLDEMMEKVGQSDQFEQEILKRRLQELVESIKKLRDQQKAQLDLLVAAVILDNLDGPLITLRRNTMDVAETAKNTNEDTVQIGLHLDTGATHQADAVVNIRTGIEAKSAAQNAETESLTELNKALELAEKLADEAEGDSNDEKRNELAKKYQGALDEQLAIIEATKTRAEAESKDRRWRQGVMQIGDRQADLRVALNDLSEELADTIVYKSVHEQIDQWTGDASSRLRKALADNRTLYDQNMAASSIGALIEALKPEKPPEEFAENEQEEEDDGGGGGGGGPQPLIPPMAELKLLRSRQTQVYDMTKMLNDRPIPAAQGGDEIVDDLSTQQSDLAETGMQLIEQLKNQQQGPPGTPAAPMAPPTDNPNPEPAPEPTPEEAQP